jgi:hypothetical protein
LDSRRIAGSQSQHFWPCDSTPHRAWMTRAYLISSRDLSARLAASEAPRSGIAGRSLSIRAKRALFGSPCPRCSAARPSCSMVFASCVSICEVRASQARIAVLHGLQRGFSLSSLRRGNISCQAEYQVLDLIRRQMKISGNLSLGNALAPEFSEDLLPHYGLLTRQTVRLGRSISSLIYLNAKCSILPITKYS